MTATPRTPIIRHGGCGGRARSRRATPVGDMASARRRGSSWHGPCPIHRVVECVP